MLVAAAEFAVREIIKGTLEANKSQVVTADDGTEAPALYAQRRLEVKAVIVDVMMPYMNGPATMRALYKMNLPVKLIVVSGLMDKEKLADVPDPDRVAFLAKPFTTEQLLITLRRLLDVRSPGYFTLGCVGEQGRGLVAPVSNRPGVENGSRPHLQARRRLEALRYSRLEVCATTEV